MADVPAVAVVGGGYAGMAAAAQLAANRVPVTVFEAAQQLGGRGRRIEYRGTVLDNGLHILLGAYRETLRMIRLVNPEHTQALLRLPLQWLIHRELRLTVAPLPAPLHLLVGLLRAQGLDLRERLAAIRFIRAMRNRRFTLSRDISVELLLAQHRQGLKLERLLWRPLCVAALNTPPAIASAQVFLNVLRDSLNAARDASDLLLARVDLSALFPEPAAAYIRGHGGTVTCGERVTAINPIDGHYALEINGQRQFFSHVICALPPHQVNAFLIGIPALSTIAASVERLRYQPIYSVWLQYDENVALPSPVPMLGFAHELIHWVFDRGALCGQRGLLGVVISASGEHQQLTHDELALAVHHELAGQIGPLPAPVWHKVIAEKRATFLCSPDLERPPQITPLKNFYLAGDYTQSDYPATIESAVSSGIACARHICGQTAIARACV